MQNTVITRRMVCYFHLTVLKSEQKDNRLELINVPMVKKIKKKKTCFTSLDSENDLRYGCENLCHHQQSFSRLLSPVRSSLIKISFILRAPTEFVFSAKSTWTKLLWSYISKFGDWLNPFAQSSRSINSHFAAAGSARAFPCALGGKQRFFFLDLIQNYLLAQSRVAPQ